MSNPYPIPRELRQSVILFGDGGNTYGPFGFKIFDVDDVEVFVRPIGAANFQPVAVEVSKVFGFHLDFFRIEFPSAVASTTSYIVRSARLHERSAGVKDGTRLDPDALEKELSAQGTVLQELRRDVDRAVKSDFNEAPLTLGSSLEDGDTLMKQGGYLVPGPNFVAEADRAERAADIAAGYASDVVSQGNVPIYATVAGMAEINVAVGINAIRVNGQSAAGDGLGGLFVDDYNGLPVAFSTGDGRDWYRADPKGNGGFWVGDAPRPDPMIYRGADRLFVGGARAIPGVENPWMDRTWVGLESSGYMTYFETYAQAAIFSTEGKIGLTVASRASDHVGVFPQAIGMGSLAVADADGGAAWEYYGTGVRKAGSSTILIGMELNVANEGDEVELNPFVTGAPGTTVVHWVRSGGEFGEAGETIAPASGAIAIVHGNGPGGAIHPDATFRTGLTFGTEALKRDVGGMARAINLAQGHDIIWYANDAEDGVQPVAYVRSYVNSLRAYAPSLAFTNDGPALTGENINLQFHASGGVNFLHGDTQIASVNQYALNLADGKILAIGGVQVVGERQPAIAAASGSDAAVINALRQTLINHGLLSAT